ncbi:MAG: hypothetical protein ACI4MH_00010 [Candidatus Coproplasma sp.]
MQDKLSVNGAEYTLIKLLGKGKGGYSYLAERDGKRYVLKQIHHEPCDYYTFGDKIQAENYDYRRLKAAGVRMPEMYDVDFENERIVKEYIEGFTVFELVKTDLMQDGYVNQMREIAQKVYAAGLNLDYFPTNFVVRGGLLYYIDYECNAYSDEWNFENWGIKYWSKTKEFLEYSSSH